MVLVVEDDFMVLRIFRRVLESSAYELLAVPSVREAKVVTQQIGSRLRLLLTDQNLRDGKGSALADDLCQGRSDLPVVLLTGDTQFKHAVYEVVLKPFNIDALRELVLKKLDIPG